MVSEFGFIDNIKSKYGLSSLGDDCAVLPKDRRTDMVITADLLVENIDFRLDWAVAEQVGHKALAVSLSDIAAMGGEAKWAMLSLGLSEELWKTDFLDRFYQGWHALAERFQVELIGGDLSRTPDNLVIDSIVGGEVPKGRAVLRSQARPGDLLYVSGPLGGAAAGLKLLQQGRTDTELVKQQLEPFPQLSLAKRLHSLGLVTSMIDISDGLSSDLEHICRASNVGAMLYHDAIPISSATAHYFTGAEVFEMALHGGEDFQLLFTASQQIELNGIFQIGNITDEPGKIILQKDGTQTAVAPGGFKHF